MQHANISILLSSSRNFVEYSIHTSTIYYQNRLTVTGYKINIAENFRWANVMTKKKMVG